MPKIKIGNVTMEGANVTRQQVFRAWVMNTAVELAGPDGEMPNNEEIKDHLMHRFKELRLELLREYDWVFLADSPAGTVVKQKIAMYRQRLRDIPQNFPDIRDALFPDTE